MLDYLCRLVNGFEREHGIHPNLIRGTLAENLNS
jgi:hypothetical protein